MQGGRVLRELDSHPGKGLKFSKNAEGPHYSVIVVDLAEADSFSLPALAWEGHKGDPNVRLLGENGVNLEIHG